MYVTFDDAASASLPVTKAIEPQVSLTDAGTCPVARHAQARHPDLMPISAKDLPKILLVLFGISITPRQAVEYATKRKLGFAKCHATGKLSTTVPRITSALVAQNGSEAVDRDAVGVSPKRRRGRPRRSAADPQ